MKVVDLHPEELLDREAHGSLTDAERARLDAHLARCAACRFERRARSDFADELSAGDEEISARRLLALVEGTRNEAPPAPREREATPSVLPPGARRRTRLWLLAAAAVLVGSVAGAGARTISRVVTMGVVGGVTETARPVAPIAAPKGVPAHVSAPAHPEPSPSESALTVPAPAAPPVSAPVQVNAPPPPERPADTAAALFDEANDARHRGDHPRAIALSRRLQARFPASREARVSYATAGQLLLDRGDASAALESFDAYRAAGSGELDEAVMVGRANALERLGRADEARGAWTELLAAFPSSPYARHARARIDRLR